MSRRPVLVVAAVVVLLAGGAWALGLFGAPEPALDGPGPGAGGPDPAGPGGGGGHEAVSPPPTRRAEVDDLLTAGGGASAAKIVARLAKPEEAKKTAETIAALEREEFRARAFLKLLRAGGEEGPAFVRGAARGAYGPELRISAVLALAGDASEEGTALLFAIAGDRADPELGAAAVTALGLAGTAEAQAALARVLEQATDPERRKLYFRTFAATSVALGGDLLADLGRKDWRIVPSERFPEGATRIATVFARERDPEIMPLAAGALARMEGPSVDDAILSLVAASEGDVRREVFETVAADLPPDRGELVARMALAAGAPDEAEIRRRALDALRGSPSARSSPLVREWAEKETDPGLRHELRQFIEER